MWKNLGIKPYTYPYLVFIIAIYGEDGTSGHHECGLGRHQQDQRNLHVSECGSQNGEKHLDPQDIYREHSGCQPYGGARLCGCVVCQRCVG